MVSQADDLQKALALSASLHGHLCPRQVLGARSAIAAGLALGLPFPRRDKRVIAFVETDGCYADGVSAASGCWLGRRTLRLWDTGRVATTFVDVFSGQAVRVRPQLDLRERARALGGVRQQAYLQAYQSWPDEEVLDVCAVKPPADLKAIISKRGARAICSACGEEVLNEREVIAPAGPLCPACRGLKM